MEVIHYPINATYIGSFKLLIEFENGELRIADFQNYQERNLKEFSELKDEKYFKSFFIKDGDLQWPNGWDVAPDYLYEISTPAEVRPIKQRSRRSKVK